MPRQFRLSVCSSVRLSVCLSVCHTRVLYQGLFRKSDGFTPNGGAEYKRVAIFDQYAAISETVIEAYLLWKVNIKSYVLYRIVPLLMTLNDPEPQFQGHSII